MAVVYISLGSNLDDPKQHVLSALQQLGLIPQTKLVSHSSLYNTPPMGGKQQPNYINAVAELQTDLSPSELFEEIIMLEKRHGRRREGARWDSRTLDLDILLYGLETVNLPTLIIPHPGITTRAFVLLPLLEIAPEVCLPSMEPLVNYLARVDKTGIFILKGEIVASEKEERAI
ncbi:MAG: 2-amino-4-hydroxy-6-hydroxymethyldihydropteridine diphosphokinase [Legionellales bacterium]|nr:2-amino-4-hydroxy-6-hydroxymethyldihydropteridine diphosphokinase [Legionellales bacterium]